nr:ATP-binding protein [Alteraurantiacibacter buctensis]
MFSIVLARYLTRPVNALQSGFRQLAQGQFDVRLAPRLGRRRDEIADLAREFDDTARRLDALVTARDRLLHEVSHELRTPLSRLLLAISIFQQQPARAQEMGLRIEREATNLSSLLGEILDLARSEEQGIGADGESYYDPILVLTELVNDAAFEAQSRELKIKFECLEPAAPETLTVRGNPLMLARSCENVLRNAIRFSSHKSEITITAHVSVAARPTLEIVISDQGPGIPEKDLTHIFEPFSTSQEPGFGLGLSIARRAIKSQRGTIEASNLPSGGLRIIISIPVHTDWGDEEKSLT